MEFHGILGDVNPIEHNGGIVYDEEEGNGPEVLYFQSWEDDGPRVSVYNFTVEDNVLDDLNYADWEAIARSCDIEVDVLKSLATSLRILDRATVYETVAAYSGFHTMDPLPREMTLEEAEEEYGEFVDRAHAALNEHKKVLQ